MSFAFSPDGTRIYAFCIGQDIIVLDSEDGHRLGSIPLAHRNITGIRATYGLPVLANSQAVPLIHPDGKKLYCGGQWHSLNVYDVDTLKHITDVELGHSMAASGMRFIKSDKDL